MREAAIHPIKYGRVKIYAAHDPSWVILDKKNLICDSSRNLFARFAANLAEPCWGVWGLAIGAGQASWANSSPTTPPPEPDPNNTPFSLYNQVKRKPLMLAGVDFLNEDDTVSSTGPTKWVQFRTAFNATVDAINVPLMEMGLLGGGTKSANSGQGTDPYNAPYWDPTTNNPDSVTLMNYTTFGSLTLPANVDMIFSWVLSF